MRIRFEARVCPISHTARGPRVSGVAATKIQSGSLYPILRRFENAGWVEVREESIDERAAGRPKRRLYRLTGVGATEGRKALFDLYGDLGVRPNWLPGFEGVGYQA